MKPPRAARNPLTISRRDFLARTAAASSLAMAGCLSSVAAEFSPPIVVFSKVYQTLHLNFDDAASVTAEAGLNGIDLPLRDGGEITPERAGDGLPKYSEALRKRGLQLPLLTTGIISTSSPHAEEILRTAKKLGVQFYRVGFNEKQSDTPVEKQIAEAKARLKDLAAMNKELGIGGLVQNHSPSGHSYLGGDLKELEQLVEDLPPDQMGVAFDIGHALIVHKDGWRPHFEKLKSHLKIAYIKDAKNDGRWVPFGEGDIGKVGYFKLLKEIGYHAPLSLHMEYDWANRKPTRERLVKAMKDSAGIVRGWLRDA